MAGRIVRLFDFRGYLKFNPKEIKSVFRDNLITSSLFLTLSSIASSSIGLAFWVLAAKLYSESEIGYASALVSYGTIIMFISRFGIDQTLTRYLPTGDKSKIIGTSFILTIIASFFICLLSIIVMKEITTLQMTYIFFCIFSVFVVSGSAVSILNTTLFSLRKPKIGFIQNLVSGTRLILLIPLISIGTYGLLTSYAVAYLFAAFFSILYLIKQGYRLNIFDIDFLKKSSHFSMGNYLTSIFLYIPTLIIPILILNKLGPAQSAYYYMAYSIASILLIIPSATTTSFFIESSYNQDIKKITKKTIAISLSILIPSIIILFFLGGTILELIGQSYASESLDLFFLVLLASIPFTAFQICLTIARIRKKMLQLILLGAINAITLLLLIEVFLGTYGINGAGFAFIISYCISSLIGFIIVR
jgi:O-antigen/teichoic acid export membrane protein